ncbi:RusA family crossover junction endodeoxyribonuclease [Clostridium sp. Cult2]|uniref:RusA family crossover junction endodeoxyribonuclease n=1 Tax=Clostridium sp. Cult2 TaxID=2079003 RepID=UPI001F00124D|nr:RusA family crossover junction endodeoxyribonuclease [Clostridium sp. Cult2]MCF6466375.1 Holliday junction resolvase [Clostridium sp. Cult2]
MKETTIVIPGELPGMNEIIDAAKLHYLKYNDMKQTNTDLVTWVAKKVPKKKKVFLNITWYCKNKRRDPDNIAAAVKFIWDGLVQARVIKNDGWNENAGWSNTFEVDKNNPRVEVRIKEV